jgi:hypothetical protein
MGRRRLRYAIPVVFALSLVGASLAIAAGQGPKQKHAAGHHTTGISSRPT